MNCIDVHRKLTADPSVNDEHIVAHLAECTACSNFADSMTRFNDSLETAAKVDIPEGLAERILLKQNFKQQRYHKTQRIKLFAIAASLLLVVSISTNIEYFNRFLDNNLSLEKVAIQHVIDERHHLHENNNVQLTALNKLIQPFNLKFKHSIGTVNYAGTCPIRHSQGAHIVVQNQQSVTTLLLMPGEIIKQRRQYNKENFNATIIPVQNGSIAIVTDKNSSTEHRQQIEQSLQAAMQVI